MQELEIINILKENDLSDVEVLLNSSSLLSLFAYAFAASCKSLSKSK